MKGDVFASVGSGTVDVFTPTGASVCSLNDGTGATFTTGSGFDKAGNFYVTNFGAAGVAKYGHPGGGLVAGTFMAPVAVGTPESFSPISVGPFAGSSFVGGPESPATMNIIPPPGPHQVFSVDGGNGTNGMTASTSGWTAIRSYMTAKVRSSALLIWRLTPRGRILPPLQMPLSLRSG